jgi:hypothetical protein
MQKLAVFMVGGLFTAPDNHDAQIALETARFERAQKSGKLAPTANPATLTAFVTTVYEGMGVTAASGATSAELKKIAKQAMDGWP